MTWPTDDIATNSLDANTDTVSRTVFLRIAERLKGVLGARGPAGAQDPLQALRAAQEHRSRHRVGVGIEAVRRDVVGWPGHDRPRQAPRIPVMITTTIESTGACRFYT